MQDNSERLWRLIATLAAVTLHAVPAQAQDATIAERLGRIVPPALGVAEPDEAMLTGREDIVILDERDFFTAYARFDAGWSSNAELVSGGDSDAFATAQIGIRAATQIAERVDVFADLNVYTARYADLDSLNFSGFGGSLGASTTASGVTVGAVYAPQVAYDEDFNDRLVTLHGFHVFAGRGFVIAPATVAAPTLTASGYLGDPSDYTSIAFEVAVPVEHRPAPGWALTARPSIGVQTYDDFFEDVTNEERTDLSAALELGARYTPNDFVTLTMSLGLEAVDSTVDALDYEAITVFPNVLLTVRF